MNLARRLGQPPVIAEVTAGIILGPSLLGLLPGDLPGHLFPAEARPVLSAVAQLGLVLFMFLAGWDRDLRHLRGRGPALTSLAAAAVLTPFALEADGILRLHDGSGTQRTYAYLLVDRLRWLERECLTFATIQLRYAAWYMGIPSAELRMPLGEAWRVGKRPYGRTALSIAAACLKGFSLHQPSLGVNGELGKELERVSPAMVHTHFEYVTTEYPRGAGHGTLLVRLHGADTGQPWAPVGARRMIARAGKRAGLTEAALEPDTTASEIRSAAHNSTRHSGPMNERGLEHDGTIAREGALDRVPAAFVPVVDAARAHITETFGRTRLHSAYLYGSIPRGTATPGVSDLDLQLALHDEPTQADRADAKAIEAVLDRAFPQIDGVGILLTSTRVLLSDVERHDGGFFIACLCTPLLGPDLAEQLPRYRPTVLLARETNGDLARVLPHWRAKIAEATTDADRRVLSRRVGRRVVRAGFSLIMPRWGGWTSDLDQSAELFGRYYPERVEQMRVAASVGRTPSPDPAVLGMLINDLSPWLAAEYTAVHGEKAPRP